MIERRGAMARWIERYSRVGLVAACAVLTTCGGDGPTGPEDARRFVLSLTSPNPSDGAILFTVSGGVITSFQALASVAPEVHFRSTGPATTRVALFGNIATGGLLSFGVSAGARIEDFSAEILQVADRDNALRSLSGYVIEVVEP